MTFSLAIDILIICLLTATTGYCVVLNRRLRQMREGQSEFVKLIESFNDATERAEAGVSRLRAVGEDISGVLGERIQSGQALSDDLSFLIDRAAPLGDQLADAASRSPATPRPRRVPVSAPSPQESGDGNLELGDNLLDAETLNGIARLAEQSDSVVEHELLDALRAARAR
jgi:hypothetical protein